jgi:hypothetical protein
MGDESSRQNAATLPLLLGWTKPRPRETKEYSFKEFVVKTSLPLCLFPAGRFEEMKNDKLRRQEGTPISTLA